MEGLPLPSSDATCLIITKAMQLTIPDSQLLWYCRSSLEGAFVELLRFPGYVLSSADSAQAGKEKGIDFSIHVIWKKSNKNVNKEVFKETLEFIHVHDSCMRRISEKGGGGSGLPTPFSYALVKSKPILHSQSIITKVVNPWGSNVLQVKCRCITSKSV